MRAVIEAVMAMASTQNELNKRLWDRYRSYPFPHAVTHMGGDDSVESKTLPSAITINTEGAIGTPSLGYTPANHIHDTTSLGFLLPLEDIDVDALGQAAVMDANLLRTLEELLLVAYDVREQLLYAIEPVEVTSTYYHPTKETYNDGVPSGVFPADMENVDDNEYMITEENLTPGQDFYFDFEGVLAFNTVIFVGTYDGASPHNLQMRIYDWISASWRTLRTLQPSATNSNVSVHVPNTERFIGTGGNENVVRIGFYHAAAGNPAHDTHINYLSVANLVGDA